MWKELSADGKPMVKDEQIKPTWEYVEFYSPSDLFGVKFAK